MTLTNHLTSRYVTINKYWDRTSKIIILIVDASLNYYFLRTVQKRLVAYHGLKKYAPLVRFNFRLMAVSICMDVRYSFATTTISSSKPPKH